VDRARVRADSLDTESIARRVDGADFETEVPGEGSSSRLAVDLLVRGIARQLLVEAAAGESRPWVVLGDLPLVPSTFPSGLTRIVQELVTGYPRDFAGLSVVNFSFGQKGRQRIVQVTVAQPSGPQPSATP
jgi:hypothetical protein